MLYFSEWATSPAYSLTDSGRIACRSGGGDGGDLYTGGEGVIYSAGAQLRPGAALRVAVIEAGSGCSDEGLALLDGRPDGTLIGKGALFVSATGVSSDAVPRRSGCSGWCQLASVCTVDC